mgnify:FL=1|tara:strand:+ start:499 stop:1968 length:1470 start_codon:yes stop_codon:yes gene_type:complete
MERLKFKDERLWKGLLVLGILLNILVCFTSDLGLDTQVKMAVDDNGSLPWGDLRPDTLGESDPEDGGQRVVLPLYGLSEAAIKATALLTFFGLIGCLLRWTGVHSAAIMSLSPAFIFSIGRGYEEVYLAAFCSLSFILLTGIASNKNRILQNFAGGLIFMLMPYAKGFVNLNFIFFGGLILGLLATLWGEIYARGGEKTRWMSKPHIVSIVVFSIVSLSMVILGIIGYNSTLAILADNPIRYMTAIGFSFLDVVILFTLFGMVAWPFIRPMMSVITSIEDSDIAIMAGYIVGIMTAIVLYVAALWTYEASIWNAEWPGIVWTMGNNGRYITMLFIPFVLLLKHLSNQVDIPTYDSPGSKMKVVAVTLFILLPLSLLASVHGQTMWTDEAAEAMNLGEQEHFLFVSEDTLAMHWLYTFYAPLDAEEKQITGHWRSIDSSWELDLNTSLSQVNTLVTSPDVTFTPEGWIVRSSGEVDFLNGGGEWRVLTRS